MEKELDKVERFANKVAQQAKMSKEAADKLLKDVKVTLFIHTLCVLLCNFSVQEFTTLYRNRLADLNIKGNEMSENYREILVGFI